MINESRMSFIKELEMFINSKQRILDSVFQTLGWTEESMKDDVKICCPVNPDHWIPQSALAHHKEMCELLKEGYQKEDLEKQPPDSTFFYEKTPNVIPVILDQSTLEKVLSDSHSAPEKILSSSNLKIGNSSKSFPKTVDRWSVQFTPEQRLTVYDFVINAAKTAEKPKNVKLEDLLIDFEKKDEHEEKPKSQLEILAEMRDYKRRRQSYRAKNVHITKKSYTEIMREVIENQTNYLMEMRKAEKSEDSRENCEGLADGKRKYTHNSDSSGDDSPKYRDHYSRHRRDNDDYDSKDYHSRHRRDDDDYDYDSEDHHSRHRSSRHSPKRKKHKRDRSRSRSRSRSSSRHKHKKSHKKKSHRD